MEKEKTHAKEVMSIKDRLTQALRLYRSVVEELQQPNSADLEKLRLGVFAQAVTEIARNEDTRLKIQALVNTIQDDRLINQAFSNSQARQQASKLVV